MKKNHSKKVFMLLVSFGPGGAEKRFSNLYQFLRENPDKDLVIDFYVPRTLVNQLPTIYNRINRNNINLIQFGLSYYVIRNKILSTSLRRLDQLYLFLLLLIRKANYSYDVAHFLNASALRFHTLVTTERKVWSCFSSDNTEIYLPNNNAFLKKAYRSINNIDCLDISIANIIKNATSNYDINVTASPCSFIDYSNATIGDKDIILTYSGSFREYKGVLLLISALKICLESCPKLKIQILGRGSLEARIRSELELYINNMRVEVGHVEIPMEKLENSLIFVSLQQIENYPSQSLLEAMATGNAVIATDVGLTHLLVNEEMGIRIDYNVDSLVNAIEYLYNNEVKACLMGKKGSQFVRDNHTVDKFWNYLRQIYLSSK
jgi:glycosyltransferase involved in cell wall biosynthesis